MKKLVLLLIMFSFAIKSGLAQDDLVAFKNFQFSFNRVTQAFSLYNESLRRDFEAKKVQYPNHNIYLRSFKSSNELELWARSADTGQYVLIKTYNVCALSGKLGPKRMEGDRQVPEGYYFIDDFNPKSDFYLSLLINYPNYVDRLNGDKVKPGGDIYIHGGCVTVGCIPMTNELIQEIYVLCLNAKLNGQNYIPVHIYPTRFNRAGLDYLGKSFAFENDKQAFWINLKAGYDYFERTHLLPPTLYDENGKYLF